jgi:hypothetical protein
MRRAVVFLALIAAACAKESTQRSTMTALSKEPTSVRGWIADVDPQSQSGVYRTVETEAARKMAIFQNMNMWIDNAPYVSGGVAENGAFVLLDVPPGNVTISFSTPTIPVAHLPLTNIPGNADVLIPGLIINRDGTVTVQDPKALTVRQSAKLPPTTATVAGVRVPVTQVPITAMADRHDYLMPPTSAIATVK